MPVGSSNLIDILNNKGLKKLYQSCFRELPYNEYLPDKEVDDIFEQYVNDGILRIVYPNSNPNEIIAVCASLPLGVKKKIYDFLHPHGYGEEYIYIADVAIAPSYRRRGIGKKLLKELMEATPDRKFILRTHEANNKGKKLYEQMGFKVIPNLFMPNDHVSNDGKINPYNHVFMIYE
jgi:ribosomal protein S18 acetylase RimI-like enzyme